MAQQNRGFIATLFENQVVLKPRLRRAAAALEDLLTSRGYAPQSLQIFLGLAEPDRAKVAVIFPDDAVLASFSSSGSREEAVAFFLQQLLINNYPVSATESPLSFHSREAIVRQGGYHNYFQ